MEILEQLAARISKNYVVGFHYQIKDVNGQLLDSNFGLEPIEYLHGAGNIIPGLEAALMNLAAGEKLRITIPPSDAYGLRDESLVTTVPRSELEGEDLISKGQSYQIQTSGGEHKQVIVVDVNENFVTLDANHPLAGEQLFYDIVVHSVRMATAAEIEAGLPLPGNCGPECSCYQ